MREIFEKIYRQKIWYMGSGSGSLPENTVEYREFLQKYIVQHDIKKVIDIGCGDWQFSRLMDWSQVEYLGIDVVDFVITANQRMYQEDNIGFLCGDVREMELPQADLVILKDVLQHWSNEEILDFFQTLDHHEHVLSINAFSADGLNRDIENGEARPVDLRRAPFHFQAEALYLYRSFRPIKKVYETKKVQRVIL